MVELGANAIERRASVGRPHPSFVEPVDKQRRVPPFWFVVERYEVTRGDVTPVCTLSFPIKRPRLAGAGSAEQDICIRLPKTLQRQGRVFRSVPRVAFRYLGACARNGNLS